MEKHRSNLKLGIFLFSVLTLASCSSDETLDGTWTFGSAACDGTDISTTYENGADSISITLSSTTGSELAEFSGCNRTTDLVLDTITASTFNISRTSETCGGACSAKCTNPTSATATAYTITGSTMTWTQANNSSHCSNQTLTLVWSK